MFVSIILSEIVDQDFLFLRVLIKVLLKTAIADELLLEFIYLLSLNCFIVQSANDVLNTRLNLDEFLPHHGDAFDHVGCVECFLHLSLVQLQCFNLFFV